MKLGNISSYKKGCGGLSIIALELRSIDFCILEKMRDLGLEQRTCELQSKFQGRNGLLLLPALIYLNVSISKNDDQAVHLL